MLVKQGEKDKLEITNKKERSGYCTLSEDDKTSPYYSQYEEKP
jgi:hypothetical protein